MSEKLVKYIRRKYPQESLDAGVAQFAALVGVSKGAVNKWVYLSRRPRYPTMLKIQKITRGRMSLSDW